MKPIPLSEEQKAKLIEMCKALFPEYQDCLLSDQAGNTKDYQHIREREFVLFTGPFGETVVFIHWFEFCHTYLMEKFYPITYYEYERWQREEGPTHIVDYLYQQFKLIK